MLRQHLRMCRQYCKWLASACRCGYMRVASSPTSKTCILHVPNFAQRNASACVSVAIGRAEREVMSVRPCFVDRARERGSR